MERNTRQRGAIRRVLQRADRPLSMAEIVVDARSEIAGLGIATVYRNIRSLLDAGWLVPVSLPGEAARYELQGKPHHHHFHCRHCDRLFEAAGCVTTLPALLPGGFLLEDHEVVLFGKCAECARGG